ncbi:CobW family GTP-binding protein [Variovorax arabinosiphilus]|uniref:CobW family GTP-binding protein n=1 Tax=Variovorax arabinosiphilus TaxID=3053498 RepID=UPI002574A8E0|nr:MULTISPECIES: GTP-binding protein [unclassified Variovorax]MDM0120749.1 GTP-binding protein [Variovorax sp. J2L1-78]MDM0127339.1 GTP-binding protein [Variovorax sp. J2L1-63]MDM0236129.1 GTP-binding protein [Variovorax sp. J2R1-6]
MTNTGGHFSALVAQPAIAGRRVPVTVLTGFLGSGKTTLLNQLLREPSLDGVAVIVNEFGAVGIDHDLIAQTHDDTVLLANGCLCCAVRGDLVEALNRLAARQDRPLRHVLIETSGLADPGPIVRTLMGDAAVRAQFVLAGVLCTADAVLAMGTLDRHPEAVRQLAFADHLLLTKTDLLDGALPPPALLQRLRDINATATLHADRGEQLRLLSTLVRRAADTGAEAFAPEAPLYRGPAASDAGTADTASHRDGIRSFVIVRDAPLPRDAFAAWLDMVIAMRGEDLLRVKGLVQLADAPDRPMVIHGVQHLFAPPTLLPAWPGPDRRTRIVFITRGVDAEALEDTLDVLLRRHMRRPVATAAPPPDAAP